MHRRPFRTKVGIRGVVFRFSLVHSKSNLCPFDELVYVLRNGCEDLWLLLVAVDCCWLLLAVAGGCWRLLAARAASLQEENQQEPATASSHQQPPAAASSSPPATAHQQPPPPPTAASSFQQPSATVARKKAEHTKPHEPRRYRRLPATARIPSKTRCASESFHFWTDHPFRT